MTILTERNSSLTTKLGEINSLLLARWPTGFRYEWIRQRCQPPPFSPHTSETQTEATQHPTSMFTPTPSTDTGHPPVNETVVLIDTVHEPEDEKIVDNVLEKVDHPESNVDKEPTNAVNDQVNPNASIEIVDNDEETKQVDGVKDMPTEEKAVQYDVLKNEFSNLQNKFESLAKVLGSHGIDIGSETPAHPSTSNNSNPEGLQPIDPTYNPPEGPVQQQVQYPPEQSPLSVEAVHKQEQPCGWPNPGEASVPKQEPHSYGWPNQEYNNPQMYNPHQWMQYPQYPPPQSYPSNFVAPYLPPNYSLPYPPADYPPPFASQPSMNPVQNAPQVPDVLYPPADQSPQSYKTPKPSRSKAPKKRATPTTQPRVTPYPKEANPVSNGQSEEGGAVPTQAFQGVIGAAKKSFQGPSKSKPKSKPAAPATQTLYPQPALPVQPLPSTGNGGRKKLPPGPSKPNSRPQPQGPEVQTLYPPSALPLHVLPAKIPRKKALPAKPKLGAHLKPLPKTVPVQYEQILQASNPFRQTKQKAPTSGRNSLSGKAQPQIQRAPTSGRKSLSGKAKPQIQRAPTSRRKTLPGKAQPQIQTLYPPIQDSQPLRRPRPEVEVLRRVTKKTIQKPQEVPRTIPGMNGVSVRKVPGPSFPMMSSSISIQKVYNPLSDPNKPQELKKVLAMTNLSVSLSRK